ncbi:MAG: hypothetical protein JF888_09445 [Candidatus Dormibacteraeota bacterium]|uniref:Carotenoid 1,2-hydratase n=1 Tax=Candidatus Dormiibacter inghamiae TaxID=3127013 RepID=A0A934N798_9BACT|nr:hypothetical protein [Candidatus Dormibacteraeota bacterium]MBJ7606786.1 hypothetical protein [Candidatus Dormibacteraeota bacterium]
MILGECLRPPSALEPEAYAYKDWLHLCVFDPQSMVMGIVNVALQGAPADDRARASGLALFHRPDGGWFGNLEVCGLPRAQVGVSSIALEQVAIAVDPRSGMVSASVRQPDDQLALQLTAQPAGPALLVDRKMPLRAGWISWYAVPRLTLRGEVRIGAERLGLENAQAYHDHNWGRWLWGQDVAWEWGCFRAAGSGPSFVFWRICDRDHRRFGSPMLSIVIGSDRRSFQGAAVSAHCPTQPPSFRLRRLPGAMAALHQDHVRPRLPNVLRIEARDGLGHVALEFRPRAGAQLITAEPTTRGYGFIHELVGEFQSEGNVDGRGFAASGLGIFEYVT